MLPRPLPARTTPAALGLAVLARCRRVGVGRAWRAGWVALLLALCLAPMLGLMHLVLHPVPARVALTQAASERAQHREVTPAIRRTGLQGGGATGHAEAPPSWLERLFAHHTSDADCLVLDQLAHDGPPQGTPLPDLAVPPLRFLAWWLDPALVAATAAPCQARAPPAVL